MKLQLNDPEYQKVLKDPKRNAGLLDGGFFLYKNTVCLKRFMCHWFNEVVMFSFRDQLSFVFTWEAMLGNRGYRLIKNGDSQKLVREHAHT